jgi:myo-inositol-1(or 4)-monophosphatase
MPPAPDPLLSGIERAAGAFVAAGLLRVARCNRPNSRDVAGGIPPLRAAGCEVRGRTPDGRAPLERFESQAGLRRWTRGMVIGERQAVELVCRAVP